MSLTMFLTEPSESLGDDGVVTAAYQLRGYQDGNTEMARKAMNDLIHTYTLDLSLEECENHLKAV